MEIKGNIVTEPVFTLENPSPAVRFSCLFVFLLLWRSKAVRNTHYRLLFYFPRVIYPILRSCSSQIALPRVGAEFLLRW